MPKVEVMECGCVQEIGGWTNSGACRYPAAVEEIEAEKFRWLRALSMGANYRETKKFCEGLEFALRALGVEEGAKP